MPSTQPSDPLAAERENERREEIVALILDRLSSPFPRDPEMHAAHRKDVESVAAAILALPPLLQQGEAVAWRAKLGANDRWILCSKDPTAEQHWHSVQALGVVAPHTSQAVAEPCFECGSTERVGTACGPCNPELVQAEAQARVEVLEAERDEAREIARVYAEHWPYGQRLARDEALRDALCAVPKPSARALLFGSTPKPALDWEAIADERGKVAADLGARLALARMTIENAVDTLNSRGRFGSPDDALASLQGTLDALRSGAPVTIRAKPVGVEITEEMVERAAEAAHGEWQGKPPSGRTWAETNAKLPGNARWFRELARAALTAALSGDA